MVRLILVLHSGKAMHWQMPSPRAVANTDPLRSFTLQEML